MVFGQIVIGPAGSGKTTYCNGMAQFLHLIGRFATQCFIFCFGTNTKINLHMGLNGFLDFLVQDSDDLSFYRPLCELGF